MSKLTALADYRAAYVAMIAATDAARAWWDIIDCDPQWDLCPGQPADLLRPVYFTEGAVIAAAATAYEFGATGADIQQAVRLARLMAAEQTATA